MHVLQNLHLIFGTKKQTKKLMDLIHQLKVCFVVTKMILSAVADTSQMMMLSFNRRFIFRDDVVTFTPRSPKDSLVYSQPILSWLKIIVAALLVLHSY